MPLINTKIDESGDLAVREMLEAAGIDEPKSLNTQLKENGIATDDLLQSLASIARGAQNESTQLRAIEMGLKLNGVLKENSTPTAPMFQVIIKDPNASVEINPILLPRR